MAFSTLIAFWAVSFLFVITPGADWAYAISAGIRGRMVPAAVGGMLSGHLIATVVVAAGVGGLVASTPTALTLLTVAGAGYLLWLGMTMLLRPSTPHAGEAESTSSWRKWAAKGLCISGLNPKVFLLFLALLPQFASTQANWPLPAQMLTLGMLHIVSCGAVYLLVGYGAERLLKARPAAAKTVSRFSGAAMVVISFILIGEQIYAHWMI